MQMIMYGVIAKERIIGIDEDDIVGLKALDGYAETIVESDKELSLDEIMDIALSQLNALFPKARFQRFEIQSVD